MLTLTKRWHCLGLRVRKQGLLNMKRNFLAGGKSVMHCQTLALRPLFLSDPGKSAYSHLHLRGVKASAETNGVPVGTRSGRARTRAAAAARWAHAALLAQAPACGPQSLAAAAPDPRALPGLARARVTRARAATARCSRASYCQARRRRFARARIYQGWRRWGCASPPAPGVGRPVGGCGRLDCKAGSILELGRG